MLQDLGQGAFQLNQNWTGRHRGRRAGTWLEMKPW